MNLSPRFTLEEATFSATATRLGIDNSPTPEVLAAMKKAALSMESVRTFLGLPIYVTSWLRVLLLNRAVKSKDASDHIQGWAIDFKCSEYGSPLQICLALKASGIKFDQLIHEFGSWVHISFGPRMRGEVLTIDRLGTRPGLLPIR